MKNIPFVLWMLLYPLLGSVCMHLSYLDGNRFDDGVKAFGALFDLIAWIYVGVKLYERPK